MYILELQNAMSKIRSHSMCLTEDWTQQKTSWTQRQVYRNNQIIAQSEKRRKIEQRIREVRDMVKGSNTYAIWEEMRYVLSMEKRERNRRNI